LDRERLSAEVTPRDSLKIMSERNDRGPKEHDRATGGSAPIGANLHANLTLRSGPQGRVSKGGQQSRCREPALSTISCVAHHSAEFTPRDRDGRYAASSG
jgi:hypothetical protein